MLLSFAEQYRSHTPKNYFEKNPCGKIKSSSKKDMQKIPMKKVPLMASLIQQQSEISHYNINCQILVIATVH